jgi:multiple sugar transport system ATP-binding protein
MATVSFKGASRIYPKALRKAVDRLNLEINDGEFLVLVGPSGCGKTTSLRMLAGLEEVDEGAIEIDGTNVVNLPPRNRDIAMVFQNYALYPHMNVAENMGFALKIARFSKSEIDKRVNEAAKILDLAEYLKRRPAQLSGGQRQRVAMGRAIVRQPRVFLMDEPLSNLDAKLRVATRSQIATLQRRLGVTTVYVTHDQVEAMTMGDRVAVMKDGVLQQCDTPRVLYDSPANAFVAGFIGSPPMNLVAGTINAEGASIGAAVVKMPRGLLLAAGTGKVTIGLRPEALELTGEDTGIPVVVSLIEELGAESFVYCQLAEHATDAVTAAPDIIVRIEHGRAPKSGETIALHVKEGTALLFNSESGTRIREQGAPGA